MKILPSLLAAPSLKLHENIEEMISLGLTHFHIDMMDFQFTHNFGLSTDLCQAILKSFPQVSLDVHLMTNPTQIELIDQLVDMGVRDITLHLETLSEQLIQKLTRSPYINVRIAIQHQDNLDYIIKQPSFLKLATKRLLILAVTPGFCGQKMQPHALSLTQQAKELGFDVMLDGGVNLESCAMVKKAAPHSVVIGGGLFNQAKTQQQLLINQLTDLPD